MFESLCRTSLRKLRGNLQSLREVVSNFQESSDRNKNSPFFICFKRPFWLKMSQDLRLKSSSEFLFWQKIRKFEIGQNVPNLHNFYRAYLRRITFVTIKKFQRVFILAKNTKVEIGQNVPNLHNFYRANSRSKLGTPMLKLPNCKHNNNLDKSHSSTPGLLDCMYFHLFLFASKDPFG